MIGGETENARQDTSQACNVVHNADTWGQVIMLDYQQKL